MSIFRCQFSSVLLQKNTLEHIQNCNVTERDPWLYNRPHNYVDFASDENGLWITYIRQGSQHVTVSKIESV